jgi:putative transposase
MMLDQNIVAVSPGSVCRVLRADGLLQRWNTKSSKKGTGFVRPLKPHEHCHIDISYVNLCGAFYYLCSILDGNSRFIVHWESRPTMIEQEVEIIVQRVREQFPDAKPRIISDNSPQFIARDFKEFIRLVWMTQVRTSPFYPQSNGKLERYHKTIKSECIRPKVALSLQEARTQIAEYVRRSNEAHLQSAIGSIAPKDKLEGRDARIYKERDQKLKVAREARKQNRREMRPSLDTKQITSTAATINQLTQQDRFSISN